MFNVSRAASRRLLSFAILLIAPSLSGCAGRRPPHVEPAPAAAERVVEIVARKWEFVPSRIVLERGVPVVLELRSADRHHGFNVPGLDARTEVEPGQPARLRLVPNRAGTFPFHCDVFCGEGHEEMTGAIVVAR
jgi:cytochrome c oxidase subunit 2